MKTRSDLAYRKKLHHSVYSFNPCVLVSYVLQSTFTCNFSWKRIRCLFYNAASFVIESAVSSPCKEGVRFCAFCGVCSSRF